MILSEFARGEPTPLPPSVRIRRFRDTVESGLHLLVGMLFMLLSVGTFVTDTWAEEIPAGWMEECLENLARGSTQALLVTGDGSSRFHAVLHVLEKNGASWRHAVPPLPVLLGEKGFAPPGEKREGDLRTPSGVFDLRRAFGYAPEVSTRMPYRQVGRDDLWVDDVSSPDYNRWVKRGETAASSFEVLKLDDHRYQYAIVVEYNTDPVVRGAGSAIFIHLRLGEGESTRGCVALAEGDMVKVLAWLDPAASPVVLLGTRESLVELARRAGRRQDTEEAGSAHGGAPLPGAGERDGEGDVP